MPQGSVRLFISDFKNGGSSYTMKKSNSTIYVIMFVLTMCFLFMSGMQREFRIFKIKPLNGVVDVPQREKLNFKNYYNFSFQKSVEKNLEVSFGFREPLIRLYNQYLWDFYDSYHSTEVLIGKDNWIFPKWHLNVPKYSSELTEKFDQQALYLYQLSNILKEYNTQLLVCFVPSKFEVYQEYVSKDIKHGDFNPIDYFCGKFDESGVNYINLTPMLYKMKNTAAFPSFSQTGAHWSNIASVYAADSIFKKLEKLSGINMPKMKIGAPHTAKTKNPDNDLELLLNLYRPVKSLPNYYADVEIVEDSTTTYSKLLTIGDSHFLNIAYNIPLNKIFSDYPYWYYAKRIFYDNQYQHVEQVDVAEEFISSDYILLLYNYFQTYYLDSDIVLRGMISLCFDKEEIDNVVKNICNDIKSNPEWRESVEQKALKGGKSFDEMLHLDATYIICQNPYNYFPQLNTLDIPTKRSRYNATIYDRFYNSDSTRKAVVLSEEEKEKNLEAMREKRISEIMNDMRESEEWMNSLKKKAKSKGKTLEEVMREDAIWVIQQE